MHSIGLGEALSLWWSGQKLDGMALYGLSTVWISRIAKIATYAAGLTVVLDIIGSERLREFASRLRIRAQEPVTKRQDYRVAMFFFLVAAAGLTLGLLPRTSNAAAFTYAAVAGLSLVISIFAAKIAEAVATLLASRSQRLVRLVALTVLSFGFFGDLLTS